MPPSASNSSQRSPGARSSTLKSSWCGANWTQVENDRLETLPYTGLIDDSFDNPLGGLQGWCNVQPWTRSVVDLGGLQDQNLNFRFRLGTDESFDDGPWHIDDVVVQSCEPTSLPFASGFESQ